jgi:ribosomal protein L37AE/L43A
MPLFGKKRPKDDKKVGKKEEHVICPHCYLDFTVERVQKAGGICPSCKGEIDLEKLPRARL